MADDVLILIDQQKAMDHPKWGPRNNLDAEKNIARLLAAWRARKMAIIHVKHDSTRPDSPFRPGQEGNDFLPLTAPLPSETVVAKKVHSAFIGTDLPAQLEAMGRPPLVICACFWPTRWKPRCATPPISASACACRPMPAGRATSAT